MYSVSFIYLKPHLNYNFLNEDLDSPKSRFKGITKLPFVSCALVSRKPLNSVFELAFFGVAGSKI